MTVVHAAYGGGGMRAPIPAGFHIRALELGVRFSGLDGVSAGALAAAYGAQADIARMKEVALGAMTSDVHRMKTGREIIGEAGRIRIGWPPVDIAINRVRSIGTNERLWSNYLSRDIRADRVLVPCWVGATDWQTGEYLSIPSTMGEWPRAVMGSATMPIIWEPVAWLGRLLVDGGLRTSIPIDDAMRHIAEGLVETPELVVAIGLSPDNPFLEPPSGILNGALRTIGILTSQVARDDIERRDWWPAVDYVVRRAEPDLGSTLEASVALQRQRFDQGAAIAEGLFA